MTRHLTIIPVGEAGVLRLAECDRAAAAKCRLHLTNPNGLDQRPYSRPVLEAVARIPRSVCAYNIWPHVSFPGADPRADRKRFRQE